MKKMLFISAVMLFLAFTGCSSKPNTSDRIIPVSDISKEAINKASVKGRYIEPFYVLNAPEDSAKYGEFNDYGYWGGGTWLDVPNNPAGYWVYVKPYWIVFKKSSAPRRG
ncbi:MAG: hypothetical protein ABIH42_04620 [Planctomycetota bacterium]